MNHTHLLFPSLSLLHYSIPFFISVEQKAASVSTSVEQGGQTGGFKGSQKDKSFLLFVSEGVQS